MRRAYGASGSTELHPTLVAATAAVVTAVAVGTGWSGWLVVSVASSIALCRRRPAVFVGLAVLACVGVVRSESAWSALEPDVVGRYEGWVGIVDDPHPYPSATRVIVEIEGERFETWFRGRASRLRADTWRAGEQVVMAGHRSHTSPDRRHRVAWQHVVGEFRVEWASDVRTGSPVSRASNRVRALIEQAAEGLPGDDGSLFRGLVVGDDRDQPAAMIERFRASGLSHLTAVSGQNVAFVLAAAGPGLVRLRPAWRWAVTIGLILWFVSLTRFEPSIVRAGLMAALAATAYVLGRERAPFHLLCWTVVTLLLIDPLLAWSVGFWLSVGATAGVATVGPWLGARLGVFGPVAMPVGVTLGAQVGVIAPAVLIFGRLPLVSVPANLLAVPVAGFVMLYGLPAGLVAGVVPSVGPLVMLPCRVGVRWVDTVAVLGHRLEPGGAVSWWGWAAVVAAVWFAAAMNRGGHGRASVDR